MFFFFVNQDIFWALKLKCFLSSGPATDGMDGQALKLENTGLTFSIFFYAIGCQNHQKVIMVSAPFN